MSARRVAGLVGAPFLVLVMSSSLVSAAGATSTWTPAPASVVRNITTIPAAVYNRVGAGTAAEPVTRPVVISGGGSLVAGAPKLPEFFVYCAEYAPFCAATRWAVVAALARFGTFGHLGVTQSSSADIDPDTATLSFLKATYSSRYVSFRAVELLGTGSGPSYPVLERPSPAEQRLITTYDNHQYFPALPSGESGFPFIDLDNRVLTMTSFDPQVLAGLTQSQIARDMRDPSNSVAQTVIATANYLEAAICMVNPHSPASVCASAGVEAARL